MCCFRICRYGRNHCDYGCDNNNGCGCGNNSDYGCGCGCECGCRGGNSGYGCGCGYDYGCGGGNSDGRHDICASARRQAYGGGFRNGYWEDFNDVTWGNPGYDDRPTPRTAGGPGPAITESGCDCNS